MVADDDFAETIGKYIDWQSHTASSYTIMMRNSAKIIEYKYKFENIELLMISQEQKNKK